MSKYPDSEFIEVQRKAAQLAKDAYEEDQEWLPTKTSRLLDACKRIETLKQQRDDLLDALKRAYFLLETNSIKDVYFEALRLKLGDLLPSQIINEKVVIAAIAKCQK